MEHEATTTKRPTESYLEDLTQAWDNLSSNNGQWTETNEKAVFASVGALVIHLKEAGGIRLSRGELAQIADAIHDGVERAGDRLEKFIEEKVIGKKPPV